MGYGAAQNIVNTNNSLPNLAIGTNALFGGDSTTPSNNTANANFALGYNALYGTAGTPSTGTRNIAIGISAINHNTSGTVNVGI